VTERWLLPLPRDVAAAVQRLITDTVEDGMLCDMYPLAF